MKLNLELSYETQSLHVFFFFFVFETALKDFPFYSPILLTIWFRYLQTRFNLKSTPFGVYHGATPTEPLS